MRPVRPLSSGASERPRDEAAGTAAEEWPIEPSSVRVGSNRHDDRSRSQAGTQAVDHVHRACRTFLTGSRRPTSRAIAVRTVTNPGAETGPIDLTIPAAMVTPAMLGAHYRLGQHRPAGHSCVARLPRGRPRRIRARAASRHRPRRHADGFRHGAAAPARGRLHGHHDPGVRGAPQPDGRAAQRRTESRPARRNTSARPGYTSSCRLPSTARPSPRSNGCCPRSWPTSSRSPATRQR